MRPKYVKTYSSSDASALERIQYNALLTLLWKGFLVIMQQTNIPVRINYTINIIIVWRISDKKS